MTEAPFPGYGHDGEEPEGFLPVPAAEESLEGAEQGLFVCLPAEDLTLAGFTQDGRADTMAPGALLAVVVNAITEEDGAGLTALSDDQLVGVISAGRRLESRAAWTQMAAMAEFARRHPSRDSSGFSEFAADELASALNLTWQSAADQAAYACAVATRLPHTFAALAAGLIHPVHVRIIEDETRYLSDADAATADEALAAAAPGKTFGQLRYLAHRLVLKLDPESALHRKKRAGQDAHVRPFREDSGNAGMVARELPTDEVLASWQHVVQRALDLRAAGMPGTLRELRVRAYLDLLQERDSRQALAAETDGTADGTDSNPADSDADPADPPGGSGGSGGAGPAGSGPTLAALVNITMPLTAMLGDTGPPGEAAGFGLLDHQTARDLVAAAARNPRTRWCLTVLHPDGTAAAHGCASGAHPWPTCDQHQGDEPPRSLRPDQAAQFLCALKLRLNVVIRGPCHHAQAQHRYRPSRSLRHLITARNTHCTAPGCGQPAARCDLDHTRPWHEGGKTCPCNLAPLCRHHHRCKQAEGWWLEQLEPGVLVWHTPAGRTYTTTPSLYQA